MESSNSFHFKVHSIQGHPAMLAIADHELVGKRFEENDMVIEVNKDLYLGGLVDENQARRLLLEYDIIILVGEKIIGLAKELGLVTDASILRVGGVPHVQIFKFSY